MLAFLVRRPAFGVQLVHALIAGISQKLKSGSQSEAAVLVKSKVMSFASACRYAQNVLGLLINHDLCFLGVALLFAGVEPMLFF